MTSAQLKITCAVHTFEVGETAMFNDLEYFIERMKAAVEKIVTKRRAKK